MLKYTPSNCNKEVTHPYLWNCWCMCQTLQCHGNSACTEDPAAILQTLLIKEKIESPHPFRVWFFFSVLYSIADPRPSQNCHFLLLALTLTCLPLVSCWTQSIFILLSSFFIISSPVNYSCVTEISSVGVVGEVRMDNDHRSAIATIAHVCACVERQVAERGNKHMKPRLSHDVKLTWGKTKVCSASMTMIWLTIWPCLIQ